MFTQNNIRPTYSYDSVWAHEVNTLVVFHLKSFQHDNTLVIREARAAIQFLQIVQHGHNKTEASCISEIYNNIIYELEYEMLNAKNQ